jgi:hypothetical protein
MAHLKLWVFSASLVRQSGATSRYHKALPAGGLVGRRAFGREMTGMPVWRVAARPLSLLSLTWTPALTALAAEDGATFSGIRALSEAKAAVDMRAATASGKTDLGMDGPWC